MEHPYIKKVILSIITEKQESTCLDNAVLHQIIHLQPCVYFTLVTCLTFLKGPLQRINIVVDSMSVSWIIKFVLLFILSTFHLYLEPVALLHQVKKHLLKQGNSQGQGLCMYISLKHIMCIYVYSLYMFMHIYVTCIYVCIYTCFMYLKKYTYESFLNYLPVEVPPTSFIFPLYHIPFVFRNILILSSKYTQTKSTFFTHAICYGLSIYWQ